jgi:GNAT superfamily N-acetyltransferase
MKFNIYDRFQVDVQRVGGAWQVYRLDFGKRVPMEEIVIPPTLEEDEIAIYLDDIFHELAGFGQSVELMASQRNVIVVSDQEDAEFEKSLGNGLDDFNRQMAGVSDRRPLCVMVKDPDSGDTLGGIVGRTSLGLAFLDLFHLPESLRGSGLGTTILAAFEAEARERGCRSAVLYTISFQAPGFYEKNGWVGFGEIASEQEGISRIFMSKRL